MMIKNIGYFILYILLILIAVSPFALIYLGVNEGENLYYLFLVMIIFFLPSLADVLLNREDRIFSFDNLFIGSLGLVAIGILSLMCYFGGDLSAVVVFSILVAVLELIMNHAHNSSKRI